MANIGHILFFSLIGGLFSLAGGFLLLSKRQWAEKLAIFATPFAAGALLAAVFLDLLPEGIEAGNVDTVMVAALIGIIVFFFAERFLRWFHHHHEHEDSATDPSVPLIIAGDTLHNAIDGVVIAAAFLVSVPTGIVTTLAVAAHEIPQEIADFGLLLSKGMKRRSVIIVNILSALATTVMAVITFALGSESALPVAALLGVSAGFLLYIAMSDVIPTIHRHSGGKALGWQPAMLIIGALIVGLAINITHSYTEAGHAHGDESHHSEGVSEIEHDVHGSREAHDEHHPDDELMEDSEHHHE